MAKFPGAICAAKHSEKQLGSLLVRNHEKFAVTAQRHAAFLTVDPYALPKFSAAEKCMLPMSSAGDSWTS
jgi:hypothetical protein